MIERINTSVDLASILRLEVSWAARARAQQRGPTTRAGEDGNDPGGVLIDLDPEETRRPSRFVSDDYSKSIRFAQSGLAGDRAGDDDAVAAEDQPALEASILSIDWRVAQAARLYTSAGRIGSDGYAATVGTRLNAVA